MNLYLRLSLIFTLVYLLCLFYEEQLFAALWILAGLLWLALWVGGLFLLILTALQFSKKDSRSRRLQLGAALLATALPLGAHLQFSTLWVRDARFAMERPRYEARVRAMLASPQRMTTEKATREVKIDRQGGVVRIAFVQPGGLLDNYTALVYDPSGAVERINGAKNWQEWESPRFAFVRELFGGDLTSAHALGGGWYRCSFT